MCYPVPLCTSSVGLFSMVVDDQCARDDFSLFIVMSTPNVMHNAEMISAFFCSSSRVADGAIRSSCWLGFAQKVL